MSASDFRRASRPLRRARARERQAGQLSTSRRAVGARASGAANLAVVKTSDGEKGAHAGRAPTATGSPTQDAQMGVEVDRELVRAPVEAEQTLIAGRWSTVTSIRGLVPLRV